jgi:hypothetical protein
MYKHKGSPPFCRLSSSTGYFVFVYIYYLLYEYTPTCSSLGKHAQMLHSDSETKYSNLATEV